MAEIRHFYPELTIISYDMGMDEGTEGGRPSNNLQRDNSKDAERQVVAIANAIAPSLVFNNVALPPNLPDHLKSALMAKADQAREAAIDAGFVRPTAIDGVASLSREERQRREDEKNSSYFEAMMTQEQRRRREQEEWSRTKSTVCGVTMTGSEWAELAQRLRNDDDLRRRVIEAFEGLGMSHSEAEARYERAAQVAEAAAIPPSQRNDEQKRVIKSAESDPTYKSDMNVIKAEMGESQALSRNSELSETFATASNGAAPPGDGAAQAPRPIVQPIGMGF
jgi:hypothetical protein